VVISHPFLSPLACGVQEKQELFFRRAAPGLKTSATAVRTPIKCAFTVVLWIKLNAEAENFTRVRCIDSGSSTVSQLTSLQKSWRLVDNWGWWLTGHCGPIDRDRNDDDRAPIGRHHEVGHAGFMVTVR
jgi:hypothetical protein